jgi:hypothetical protein
MDFVKIRYFTYETNTVLLSFLGRAALGPALGTRKAAMKHSTAVERAAGPMPDAGPALEQLIDRERYPITELEGPAGRALVARCRSQLETAGACVLEDFLLPAAAARARAELEGLLDGAYYCQKDHNPYLAPDDPALPPDHPRNRPQVSDVGCLADDQIPAGSLLRRLYLWDRLRAFLAVLLDVDRLYPYADPLGSLNLNVFQPGQQLGWHYDNADWSITLMLQPAEAGGVYEYRPWTRTAEDENYRTVARILDGEREGVRELAMGVGALVLFRGRRSLHRVTPCRGSRPRLLAVLSYDTQPGVTLSEHNRLLFYGRTS